MEMEVEEGNNTAMGSNAIFVCYITKKQGLKKSQVATDFSALTLETLKNNVIQELNKWEGLEEVEKSGNIDILHNSRILQSDEDVKRVKPLSAITVIRRTSSNQDAKEDHQSAKYIADYAASRNINDQLKSCSIALRTAFLNPKFVTMIENLGDSDKLENIFAIVPELKNDPVAIGIIQDPTLIFHLSDPVALKKVASTKPWIIEAFNFISASIHQEKGPPSQGIPGHLFNTGMFDGEDESMEEGDDDENGSPGPSRGGARITREHLAAALSALGGAGGAGSANAFNGLFQAAVSPSPSQQHVGTPSPVASAGANIQNLMNTLAGAGGGIPGQPLSSEVVARAVTDALRRLTPDQRGAELANIRNLANQIQQSAASAPSAPSQIPQNPVTPSQAPPLQQQSGSSLAQQYQSQLRQMREMGIVDERLSILALQVSEGDVNTAVELIFSGWRGEGSDPMD